MEIKRLAAFAASLFSFLSWGAPRGTKLYYRNNCRQWYAVGMKEQNRVLFVDDESAILDNFKLTLRKSFEVHTAGGAKEALELMAGLDFSVVVSDLKMPEIDGIVFLGTVKEKYPDSVRILLTGHADLDSAVSAINEGEIFRFLQKSCDAELLKKVLQDAVRQYQLIMAEHDLVRTHQKLADAYMDVKVLSDQQARLIATASHDLRSPLVSIAGFARLISHDLQKMHLDDGREIKRINDNLAIIREESERMSRLVADFLDGAKLGAHAEEWPSEPVDLCTLINKARNALLGRLAEKPGVEVRFQRPEECPTIVANPDRLMQVFVNLLDNAVKFTSKGYVRIELKKDNNGDILASVKDSGCGIEPERLECVFDSYHSTDTDNKVSGLGLSICKQIVEYYKGTIGVASEKDAGTTFTVRLPARSC